MLIILLFILHPIYTALHSYLLYFFLNWIIMLHAIYYYYYTTRDCIVLASNARGPGPVIFNIATCNCVAGSISLPLTFQY